jgi:hypothetical protein
MSYASWTWTTSDGIWAGSARSTSASARRPWSGPSLGRPGGPHWDWVCDKLTDRQLRALRTYTMRHLDMVNHRVEHPDPVAILG